MIKETELANRLEEAVCKVILGQQKTIRRIIACMFAGGHVLLEDFPGTGKTTLAKAISRSISGTKFKRVQFTPDLLPSDILGVSVLNPQTGEFRFQQGPIFTDILLADEINRASPRTQSALLEAMGEQQVTIEGRRHDLEGLFFVIATQNPVEFRGTYPLPEAQMDRFAVQCRLGYISENEEAQILSDQTNGHPVDQMKAVISESEIAAITKATRAVRISEELRHYAVALVAATRKDSRIKLAASPRASLALMKLSQAMALLQGSEFVTPDIIQDLAVDVIAHRLVLPGNRQDAGIEARNLVEEIVKNTPVPA